MQIEKRNFKILLKASGSSNVDAFDDKSHSKTNKETSQNVVAVACNFSQENNSAKFYNCLLNKFHEKRNFR